MLKRFLINWCLKYLQDHASLTSAHESTMQVADDKVEPGFTTITSTCKTVPGMAYIFFFKKSQLRP